MAPDNLLTVSALNQAAKFALEDSLGSVWVTGEVSNFVEASSGHCYFSLKDEKAQVRCAFFRGAYSRLGFALKSGMHINVKGNVSLYAPRGDYQLIVTSAEDAGVGALQKAFLELKAKLEKEGLFDKKYKQALPAWPKRIGVITSDTGAAIKDVLYVMQKRMPSIPIILYPTLVQGKTAHHDIVRAIQLANTQGVCDVLLLVRGGGSLEDLWSFNEEEVARAIFASNIPLVSGVGHEVDFTIADFTADLRAATPSAAAAAVSPDCAEISVQVAHLAEQLEAAMQRKLSSLEQLIYHLSKRLRSPEMLLVILGLPP